MSVKTIYELRIVTKLAGHDFCALSHFDELESTKAMLAYDTACKSAQGRIGKPWKLVSYGGVTTEGVVSRVQVDLVTRKTDGSGWVSGGQLVGAGTDRERSAVWSHVVTKDEPEEAA